MIQRILQLQEEFISALECATRLKAAMIDARSANRLGESWLCAKASMEAIQRELQDEIKRSMAAIQPSELA